MNKKVFNKYVVFSLTLMTLVWSRCSKNEIISENECTSDCFVISGKIINASTNLPEQYRRIQVRKATRLIDVELGYVNSKADGSYIIKLNKSTFADTSDVNVELAFESKNGYINSEHYTNFYLGNLDLNKDYEEDFYVFQETSLNLIAKNTSPDTITIGSIYRYFTRPGESNPINVKLAPNESYSKVLVTTFGIPTDVSVSYKLKGASKYSSIDSSIICNPNGSNYLQLNIQ